jgi:site-specific recombinase XerD
MNTKEVIESRLARLRTVMATSKSARALNTERTYVTHIRQFLWFCAYCPEVKTAPAEELARLYVESKARHWAVATVNQFRNALVYYYKHVVEKPLGDLGQWAEAKRPKRLPVWLPDAEAVKLWGKDQRVTVHSLRHSFATEMLMSGMPIHELKELMGHAHIDTTEIYLHCLPRLTTRRGSPMDRQTATPNVLHFPVHPSQRRSA